jgi:hypothetical protein
MQFAALREAEDGPFRCSRRRSIMSEIEGLTDVTRTSRFGGD